MVKWPCILKFYGDDELIYLSSENNFHEECLDLIFTGDDYIVDSFGSSYLINSTSRKVALTKEKKLTLDEVTQLIRANEFKKGELCLTKIVFLTISDAIKSIRS